MVDLRRVSDIISTFLAPIVVWSGLGYGGPTGTGGVVTQATNKATAVTLNKMTGQITLNAASLNSVTPVTFILNDSFIAANDIIICNHFSAGTVGPYRITAQPTGAGTANITVSQDSGGALAEAIVVQFFIFKLVIV